MADNNINGKFAEALVAEFAGRKITTGLETGLTEPVFAQKFASFLESRGISIKKFANELGGGKQEVLVRDFLEQVGYMCDYATKASIDGAIISAAKEAAKGTGGVEEILRLDRNETEGVKMLRERIRWNFIGIPAVDKEKISEDLVREYGEFLKKEYGKPLIDFLGIEGASDEEIVRKFSETDAFRKIAREHSVLEIDLRVRLHRSVANTRTTLLQDAMDRKMEEMARARMGNGAEKKFVLGKAELGKTARLGR